MNNLYHFTSLVNLCGIMREGITRGEFPLEGVAYKDKPHLPNLTRNPEPRAQTAWRATTVVFDKTRVRLTVDTNGLEIRSFRDLAKEYKMRSKWLKALSRNGAHYDWFHSMSPIPLSAIGQIEIAITKPFNYDVYCKDDVSQLCDIVSDEFERCFTYETETGKVYPAEELDDPYTWLIDNETALEPATGDYATIPGFPPCP